MRKTISILLALLMTLTMSISAFAADFSDTKGVPQADAIDVIETLDIVEGFEDGTFGPNKTLTRAQLCTMLTRALYGDPIYTSSNRYKDVSPNHWANAYINTALAYGMMEGYGNGYFGPEKEITYTQMAAVLMKALGYDCGKMDWPEDVNAYAHTLGLFEDVNFDFYSDGCTRGNAAQMIYNAFELNYVDHMSTYPVVIKNKTFLKDGLGFKETIEVVDGHQYEAYIDLNDKDRDTLVTNNCLTYEAKIYPVGENGYKTSNKYNAEIHTFDWTKIEMYVNDELNTEYSKWFNDNYDMIGVFTEDDELITIFVTNEGGTWVANSGKGLAEMPNAIYNKVIKDEDFSPRTSTVTYFAENEDYKISNKIVCGFVTDVTVNSIWVDDKEYSFKHNYNNSIMNEYIVIYYDYANDIADSVIIEDAYRFNIETEKYHTWECYHYNDRANANNWRYNEEQVKNYLTENNLDSMLFEPCDHCHTDGKLIISK